jgi:hypothetical protein
LRGSWIGLWGDFLGSRWRGRWRGIWLRFWILTWGGGDDDGRTDVWDPESCRVSAGNIEISCVLCSTLIVLISGEACDMYCAARVDLLDAWRGGADTRPDNLVFSRKSVDS